jgi:hypothetical protein
MAELPSGEYMSPARIRQAWCERPVVSDLDDEARCGGEVNGLGRQRGEMERMNVAVRGARPGSGSALSC